MTYLDKRVREDNSCIIQGNRILAIPLAKDVETVKGQDGDFNYVHFEDVISLLLLTSKIYDIHCP